MQRLPDEIQTVINYLRRSRQDEEREKRTGEDTLSEQKQLMDRVLSQYTDITYDQRQEIGSGDKIETRPVFREVVEELRAGKYDAVAVKEISRLGRGSYTDMGVIYDLIQQNRIYIITPYKIYDPKNNADLRQIRFELFLSREEFETTRERLMGSRYSYAMSGKWMAGSVPYGYSFDPTSQRLIPNEEEAKIVRLIFELYVHGLNGRPLGYQAISSYLRKLGVPAPESNRKKQSDSYTWHVQTIRRTLLRRAYVGVVEFRKTQRNGNKQVERPESEWIVVEDAHEPIVDKELFEAAQERMGKRKPAVKLNFSPSELAGIVTCGSCGRKMIRQSQTQHYKKKDGSVSTYEKEFLWCPNGCGMVKYRDVEDSILKALRDITEYSEDKLHVFSQTNIERTRPDVDIEQLQQRALQKKRLLETKLARAKDLMLEGKFTWDEFEETRSRLNDEIQEMNRILVLDEGAQQEKNPVDIIELKEQLQSVVDAYQILTDKSRKNALLTRVLDRCIIQVTKKGVGRRSTEFTIDPYIHADFIQM